MTAERQIPMVLVAVSLAVVLLVPAVSVAAQAGPAVCSSDLVTSQPDAINIFVWTSRETKYRAELIEAPRRLIIDLEDTVYAWRKTPFTVGADPVTQIRGGQYRRGVSRVVFDLTRDVGYAIREDDNGLAIIIPTAPIASRAMALKESTPADTAPAPAKTDAPAKADVAPPPPAPVRIAQATPAPARPAGRQPSNGSRLISFDFKDADVVNLLRILAAESTKNIVISDDVKGRMSISLRNVPWELAFQTILDVRGLEKIEKDNVVRIVSREAKLKADTEIAKAAEVARAARVAEQAMAEQMARGPLKEETIRLAYADPEDVVNTLKGILGLAAGGAPPPGAPGGPPLIPAPPFSALYGTAPPPPPGAPAPVATPEVLARGITIQAHKPTNSVFIRHYEADLERIKKLIREKLDVPLPQVKIEARLNELNRTDFFSLGITWGAAAFGRARGDALVGQGFAGRLQPTGTGIAPNPLPTGFDNSNLTLGNFLPVSATTGLPLGGNIVNFPSPSGLLGGTPAGIAFGIVGGKFHVNLVLDALEELQKTTSLAKPEVVTVENAKATISLGSEIPYATVSSAGTQVQFKEALLKLEVTPTVIREAGDVTRVKMVVNVENNSQGTQTFTIGGGSVPTINKRTAATQVVVKAGETLAIGGIRQRETSDTLTKVPFFGDIPVLGYLFRSKTSTSDPNREMVVFITPYVLKLDLAQAPAQQPTK